ncbi:hypothetical protein Tco_0874407 [Tanacetum coccineum]|uniref:Retrovirus-related Pol polyprotein from transposon TNT 1-94-like beta-barrel domain-containing protein n=1 Tax=Tanacetum coccineum TaxID=301880 RepID=A0ABQ5BLW1_9ASTR
MEAGTTSTTLTAKLPILNLGDYDLWLMRIEQYFLMTDYSLWEVIKNGNKVLKRTVGETKQEYKPTTAEEKQDKRNEIKARGTLMMALPNKDQLKFRAIVKHFVRNAKFESMCAICNKRLFDANHDMCLVDYVNDVNVVQNVLWYLDSGCSKHMTRNCSQLINFVSIFLGTVKFGNDHIPKIIGYGDYQMGNVTIS